MHYTIYHLVTLSNTMREQAAILSAHTTRTQAVRALRSHNRQRRLLGTNQVPRAWVLKFTSVALGTTIS